MTVDSYIDAVLRGLKRDGFAAYKCSTERLPDLVVAHEDYGILAVQVVEKSLDLADTEVTAQIKKYVRNLRRDLDNLDGTQGIRFAFCKFDPTFEASANEHGTIQVVPADWLKPYKIERAPISSEISLALKKRFSPVVMFEAKRRLDTNDPLRQDRETLRYALDSEQVLGVYAAENTNIYLEGPPGSGKTLVLIARAKDLARKHPDWNLDFVVFNRTLKNYIDVYFENFSNVRVSTFYECQQKWAGGFRVGESEASAMRQFRHIATNGFLTQNSDAIFVDEGQDFNEAWLRFLLSSVRPGMGGVSIAGDSNQALYTTFDQTSLVADFNIQQIRLLKPYRSTKQIVEFVDALSVRGTYDDSDKLIPEGPKPSLVYVPRHRDYVKMAEAVASDIYEVMAANDKLRFSDIAVLCTTQYVIRGFSGKFRDALAQRFGDPVPTTPIWPRAGFLLDTRENSIKILTLHGAKGLEFAHIAMIGLEEIPDQSEEVLEADGDFRGNYYLIGPTRAKDTLAIYYSKDNIYLERLLGHEELFTMRAYPDDY